MQTLTGFKIPVGRSGIEAVLRARQEAHVKQFLCTEAAFQAGTVTQHQIQALQADADRYDQD